MIAKIKYQNHPMVVLYENEMPVAYIHVDRVLEGYQEEILPDETVAIILKDKNYLEVYHNKYICSFEVEDIHPLGGSLIQKEV